MLAAAAGGDALSLSYLCQVGVDPFGECPFLHGLLLICKSEFPASLTHKKQLNDAQSSSLLTDVRHNPERTASERR